MRCEPAKTSRTLPITEPKTLHARLYTAKGRVQGVWFRDSTRREAQALGISGYARNLGNGDVEVLGCGTADALDRLQAWLQNGPPLASVTVLEVETVDFQEFDGFSIR